MAFAMTFLLFVINDGGIDKMKNLRRGLEYEGGDGFKYNNVYWNELPKDAQKAARVLGFKAKSWDHSQYPPILEKPWELLNSGEKDAAITLGYSQRTWNQDIVQI